MEYYAALERNGLIIKPWKMWKNLNCIYLGEEASMKRLHTWMIPTIGQSGKGKIMKIKKSMVAKDWRGRNE